MSQRKESHMNQQEMFAEESEIQKKNLFCAYNHCEAMDIRKDYAEVRLKLVDESMNFRGTVHGGAYFTMADMCAGMVCRTDGRSYATQHASVEYIRRKIVCYPARECRIYPRCKRRRSDCTRKCDSQRTHKLHRGSEDHR